MRRSLFFWPLVFLLPGCASAPDSVRMIDPVDFSKVRIEDDFFRPRLDTHAAVTLNVCIDQCENKTARVRNFEIGAGVKEGVFEGLVFDDSDLYKMIEGVSYSLWNKKNPELEAKMDYIIDCIAKTQLEDGYLMTYYILQDTSKRWTDMDKHEMYCGGHLIEAAIAYYHATGKRTLLDVAIKYADHMKNRFGPGKKDWVPGHQEIELALVKLAYVTGNHDYIDFAQWLLEQRGHGKGTWRESSRGYYQDLKPVREQRTISGHAERARYMFTAMADVAAATSDAGYLQALDSLWNDVVYRHMYLTGGIGSSRHNEGFTEPYDLPNKEAYCETCASVGMVMWNQRMNLMSGDAKYVDIMERSMYNGALAGVSLKGDKFFYVNPLESDGTHHRQYWYQTACCPSQISRFLPSIGGYIYAVSADDIYVNLYIGNQATFDFRGRPVTLRMSTAYPWEGNVKIEIDTRKPFEAGLKLRIPQWCENYRIRCNGQVVEMTPDRGYVTIARKWNAGDVVELDMELDIRVVAADPRVKADVGKRAIQRGPIVYCMEQVDNDNYDQATITENMTFSSKFDPNLLGGVVSITGEDSLQRITLVPYYAWDNREAGKMKVWIDKK